MKSSLMSWQEYINKWEGIICHQQKILDFLQELDITIEMQVKIIRDDIYKTIEDLTTRVDYFREKLEISQYNSNAFIKHVNDRFALILCILEINNVDLGEFFVKMLKKELTYKKLKDTDDD